MILSYNNGLHIEGVPFALDAARGVPFAFASHAHADHCGRHRRLVCTPETADLVRLRYGRPQFFAFPVNGEHELDGCTIRLFHSGHVLGSAQLLITLAGRRILYTGDLKPAGGRTTPPAQIPECDILITESTFGRPEYAFPPQGEIVEALVVLIKRAFVRGLTPVLLAYALGKAQEVMALLEDQRFRFACHRMVYDVVKVYREHGVPLVGAELFDSEHLDDRVVVMPPGLPRSAEWKKIANPFTIFLSGWALDRSRRRSFPDAALPLSDHADYPQLMDVVNRTKARQVFTHHGFADLAGALRTTGLSARHLQSGDCVDMLTGQDAQLGAGYDLFR